MTNRREFVAGAAAVSLLRWAGTAAAEAKKYDLQLGVATYSLRKFPRAAAIQIIQKLGIQNANVKEYHLPYKASAEELRAGCKEFADAGLKIIAGGNISLSKDDDADMRQYFEYAKTCGMPVMVCAPTRGNLQRLEKFVKEYDIRAAIHNHGPEDKQFPSPYDVLDAVKGLDTRVGLCIDVGHTTRAGADVVKSIADAGPRLHNLHAKDLRDAKATDSQCEAGQGIIPFAAMFRQLKKMNYKGSVDLEYEIHDTEPFEGMRESFAYMHGVLDGLKTA